jgi:hypothetical protein
MIKKGMSYVVESGFLYLMNEGLEGGRYLRYFLNNHYNFSTGGIL